MEGQRRMAVAGATVGDDEGYDKGQRYGCMAVTRRWGDNDGWQRRGLQQGTTRAAVGDNNTAAWQRGIANPLRERHHEDKQAKKNA
ncbi:hypothetical protein B296_00049017 [Ensete ventricosum]|uniref:Uncharacterized protein n=1 Tax=Ensete ventricosum TaxID=4639 RepID=A0A426YQ83_ENSVE|nr:hypothetical protein B296_00049017 [Ensete ventricosum]